MTSPFRHRNPIIAIAVFLSLVTLAVAGHLRLPEYRSKPIDFTQLKDGEYLLQLGLTRRQAGSVKIGFNEQAPPPRVGVFGNHQFGYFDRTAFGPAGADEGYFFNNWYANLALPEIRDYLAWLNEIGKLPTDTIIVQVTTPNNDNGGHIINYNGELPRDLHGKYAEDRPQQSWYERAYLRFNDLRAEAKIILNYQSVLSSMFPGGMGFMRSSDELCIDLTRNPPHHGLVGRIVNLLPSTLASYAGELGRQVVLWRDCSGSAKLQGFKGDGSVRVGYFGTNLLLNQHRKEIWLKPGDEDTIVRYMFDIDHLGRKAGRKVVFVVPPVYESENFVTEADRIFTKALAQLDGRVFVLDHRYQRQVDNFISFDHPGPVYFQKVAAELAAKNFLP